jgi:predicted phage baseplate assembly protein
LEEAAAPDDPVVSELAVIDRVDDAQVRTTLHLEESLAGYYDRETVTIAGNVVLATHGETVAAEPLGSGDASVPHQRFTLRKPPLTHVSAPTPSGTASTLEVRVDGVRWEEAPAFHRLGPAAERYVVRQEDDGTTRVLFGDGADGARVPSGVENVVARYRSGIGLGGEVGTGSLTLLQSRPFGVRGVTNPLPASGAADPEALEDARANAPVTVLTLDRIVSLRDHEDFARTFAGVGKAQATALWNGETQVVHVTVATAGGDPVAAGSTLMTNLRGAMDAVRDPVVPLVVQGHTRIRFLVAARLLVDERHEFAAVAEEVTATLLATFDFAHRHFGQAVTLAEVVAVAQAVPGVVAVDVNALHRDLSPPALEVILVAASGRRAGAAYQAAELLLVAPGGIALSEMPR